MTIDLMFSVSQVFFVCAASIVALGIAVITE